MKETQKLNEYRVSKGYGKYFKGEGIDLGCGRDILDRTVFPTITSVRPYDLQDGDAQLCENVASNSLDFVYSSHCLEHMRDPVESLKNWIRICKPNGYVIFAVPHEIYYEKNCWPSKFNSDHKWSFRMERATTMPKSVNIFDLLAHFSGLIEETSVDLLLRLDYTKFHEDQTLGSGICQIEVILKKKEIV